jgi:protein TonB
MSRRSQVISLSIHIGLIVLLLFWRVQQQPRPIEKEVAHIVYIPAMHAAGGGGGTRSIEPARRGALPTHTAQVFIPPTMHLVDYQPRLTVPIAMDNPPDVPLSAEQLGDPNGRGILGGGPGGPDGIGSGIGKSIGPGTGDQYGPGDGVYSVGHGVSLPIPIQRTEPEYSEAARRARISGSVMVYAEIGPDGKPRNLRVTQGLGLGLDAKALEAVAKWLFKPGMRDGKPVTVRATFQVNFRLL